MTPLSGRRFAGGVAAIWLLAAVIYLWTNGASIALRSFPDPDDAMRFQEVRDWIAGQSWFDVGQHRMNAPWGTSMHWTRLLDPPIAAVILMLRPFVGAAAAETAAVAIVPLLIMLCVMLALGFASRRLLPERQALLAAGLVPLTVGAVQQLQPLRIDHHGWQMALACAMLMGLLDPRTRRSGLIVGGAAALWLTISLEGLPMAAAAGAWIAIRWLRAPDAEAPRLRGYADALLGVALAAFLITHRPGDWLTVTCDALSIIHIAAIVVASAGIEATFRIARSAKPRFAGLAITALAAAAVYRLGAPQCAAGAFSGMDPLVQHYWYLNVIEGLPVWRLGPGLAITSLAFPLVGLGGTLLAWRSSEGEPRARWLDCLVFVAAAVAVGVMVQRATAVAALLALPGGVWLLMRATALALRLPSAPIRVPLTAAVALLLMPLTPALLVASMRPTDGVKAEASTCATVPNYRSAQALPTSALLTDIDIGPGLLVNTSHAIVASGHHRNQAGLHDVIATFTGTAEQAHAILRRRNIGYLVVCSDLNEMSLYAKGAPNGFWVQLKAGRVPAWLKPVRIMNSELSVWQVVG